ncbi:transcription factor 23 [Carettochelys insculpta]|uniref:transcription factor 23 n=1 Tax=Carettochelys insculpta TaxID=44489 RepID=UPI003EBAEF5E
MPGQPQPLAGTDGPGSSAVLGMAESPFAGLRGPRPACCTPRPASVPGSRRRRHGPSTPALSLGCRRATGSSPGASSLPSLHPRATGARPAPGRGRGGRAVPGGALGRLCPENAARERSRVRTLRQAFLALQAALPAVPPDTKLSKLDVLVLATSYIAHLSRTLHPGQPPAPAAPPRAPSFLHPLKKWPMRSHLYAGAWGAAVADAPTAAPAAPCGRMGGPKGSSPGAGEVVP